LLRDIVIPFFLIVFSITVGRSYQRLLQAYQIILTASPLSYHIQLPNHIVEQ